MVTFRLVESQNKTKNTYISKNVTEFALRSHFFNKNIYKIFFYLEIFDIFLKVLKEGRGAKMLQTYRNTDPPTKRVLEEHSLN